MISYVSAVASKFPNGLPSEGGNGAVQLLKTDFRSAVALGAVARVSDGQFTTSPTGVDALTSYDMTQWFKPYFGNKTQFYIQQLTAGNMTGADDAAKIADALTNIESRIQSTSLSIDPAARELYTILKKRVTNGNPQAPLLIQRRRNDYGLANVTPLTRIPSVYWKYDCVLDPGMASFISGSYMAQSEAKGGDLPPNYGDADSTSSTGVGSYRFKLVAFQGSGSNVVLEPSCDNVANILDSLTYPENYNAKTGFYFAPFTGSSRQINVGDVVRGKSSLTLGTIQWSKLVLNTWTGGSGKGHVVITNGGASFTNGEVLQIQVSGVWTDVCSVAKFWNGLESNYLNEIERKYQYSTPVSVPLGVPLRFEFRIVAPQSRTDLVTGITQCAVTNLSTLERITICDFRGGIQMGAAEEPLLSRIFIFNPYSNFNNETGTGTGTDINLAHRISNLEVWTDAPWQIV